ncbi:hypothetical protein P9112_003571 [Eukaryota sp. TZLM1-RC]
MPLGIINKSQKPRGMKPNTANSLNLLWYANKKAWMTSSIFTDYCKKLNEKMRANGRQILLLIDNAPSHILTENLSNVRTEFLLKNATSHIQPLDSGIIAVFKRFYSKPFLRKILPIIVTERVTQDEAQKRIGNVDVLPIISSSWSMVTRECISNCWRKVGLLNCHDRDSNETGQINDNETNFVEDLNVDLEEFDDIVAEDEDIATEGILSVEECLDTVRDCVLDGLCENDINEDESRPKVSRIEAYNALQIIKSYAMDNFDQKHPSLYTLNEAESELETIRLKRKKQIPLMNFLTPKLNEIASEVIDIE